MSSDARRRLTSVDPTFSFDSVFVNDGSKLRQINKYRLRKLLNTDVIVKGAEGTSIFLDNASDASFRGMRLFGKSAQERTTGKNLLNVKEKLTISSPYGIDVNIPAGTYKFSFLSETHKGAEIPYFRFYTNGVWLAFDASAGEQTVVLSQDETKVYIYTNGMSASNSDGVQATFKQIMVSIEGGEYEPYSGGVASPSPGWTQDFVIPGDDGDIELNVYGKNYLKDDAITKRTACNGITCEYEGDGIFHIYGTYNGASDSIQLATSDLNIPIDPDDYFTMTTRVISGEFPANYHPYIGVGSDDVSNKNWFSCYLTPDVQEGSLIYYTSRAKDVLAEANKLSRFWIYSYNKDLLKYTIDARIQVWIERGKASTEYEPFNLQKLIVSTPNGLPGIKVDSGGNHTDADGQQWICDEVDLERGVYIQRVKKREFTGSEYYGDYISTNDAVTTVQWHKPNTPMLCTHARYYGGVACANDEYISFKASYFGVTTSDELVALLTEWYTSGNPLTILYCLNNPVETALTEEELAAYAEFHANNPITDIKNDADAWMEVEYEMDTQKYISSLLANAGGSVATLTEITLKAASWTASSDGSYYTQTVAIENATENSKVDLQPTPEQIISLINDGISMFASNENGTIKVYAVGDKPSSDMTIQATKTEVVYA